MEIHDHKYFLPSVSSSEDNRQIKTKQPDFSSLCRICAIKNEYLIPIFEGEGIQLDLLPKVEKYLPVTIDSDDELPTSMCYQCASSIISWHDLVQSSITAEKQLQNMRDGLNIAEGMQMADDMKEEIISDSSSCNQDISDALGENEDISDLPEESKNSPAISSMDCTSSIVKNFPRLAACLTRDKSPPDTSNNQVTSEKSLARRRPKGKSTKASRVKEEKDKEYLVIIPDVKLTKGEVDTDIWKRKRKQASYHLNSDFIYDGFSHGVKNEISPEKAETFNYLEENLKQTRSRGSVINDRFQCRFCSKSYSRKRDMSRHEQKQHCKELKKTRRKTSLKVIKSIKRSANQEIPEAEEVSLTCDKCQAQFRNKLEMIKHLKEAHADLFSIFDDNINCSRSSRSKNYFCNICSYFCKGRNTYLQHHRSEHRGEKLDYVRETNEQMHPCEIDSCQSCFSRPHDLFRHQRKKHPERIIIFANKKVLRKIIVCRICQTELMQDEDAKLHVRQNHNVKEDEVLSNLTWACNLCDGRFDSVADLVTHGNAVHSGVTELANYQPSDAFGVGDYSKELTPATCDVCGLTFKHRYQLTTHKSRHITMEDRLNYEPIVEACKILINNEPNYRCNECSRLFSKEDLFIRHLILHKRGKAFCCHLCGLQVFTQSRLNRHMNIIHLKKREFKCDICGHAFAEKQAMNDHRRSHTGERPYQCKICGKMFPSWTCVYSHKRSHTDYFPFRCTEPNCGSKFRAKYRLIEHMRRHTGERPFECPIESCSKTFRDRRAISRHLTVHTNARPHICSICNRTYKHKKYLSFHMKANHGLTMAEYNEQFTCKTQLSSGLL